MRCMRYRTHTQLFKTGFRCRLQSQRKSRRHVRGTCAVFLRVGRAIEHCETVVWPWKRDRMMVHVASLGSLDVQQAVASFNSGHGFRSAFCFRCHLQSQSWSQKHKTYMIPRHDWRCFWFSAVSVVSCECLAHSNECTRIVDASCLFGVRHHFQNHIPLQFQPCQWLHWQCNGEIDFVHDFVIFWLQFE